MPNQRKEETMEEEQAVLNTTEDSPASDDSIDGTELPQNDFMSSDEEPLEDTTQGEALNAEEGEEAKKPEHEEFVPYDRFKEVNDKVAGFEEYRTKAEQKEAALQQQIQQVSQQLQQFQQAQNKPEEAAPEPDFVNLATMKPEEAHEWQDTDPIGYQANVAKQIMWETKEVIKQQVDAFKKELLDMGRTHSTQTTAKTFLEQNKEFDALARSGEINRVLDANPLLQRNPVAAFNMIMKDRELAKATEDREAAIAEAVQKTKDDLAGKRLARENTTVLSGTTRVPPSGGEDAILQNTSKYGGPVSAIAKMLRDNRRRAASGG